MKSTQQDSSWPRYISPEERWKFLEYWEKRFGVPPATFAPYDMAASSRVTYLIRRSPHIREIASVRITRAGIPFMRNAGIHLKPVTEAVQLFGNMATRNVVSLPWKQLTDLCSEGEIKLRLDTDSGFVFIKEGQFMWGCALFLEPDRLLNRLPKNIIKALTNKK